MEFTIVDFYNKINGFENKRATDHESGAKQQDYPHPEAPQHQRSHQRVFPQDLRPLRAAFQHARKRLGLLLSLIHI